MPEPEKGLELNIALVKQLTGGDTYTGRLLHENPVEFAPEFKIFVNTNHLPRASDDTVFASGRVKLIPFNRHFTAEEQDNGLKKFFRKPDSMSGIFNWLVEGYRLLMADGLTVPEKVIKAINDYRHDVDPFLAFSEESLIAADGNRLKTSDAYKRYQAWAKSNGYRPVNNQEFVAEMKKRFHIHPDYKKGNCIWDYDLKP